MFYLFAVGSMLAYVLQGTLVARYARSIDGLSLGFYRGTSFFVTLLPLLFGITRSDMTAVAENCHLFLMTAVCGGAFLGLSYTSYRYLAIGISSGLYSGCKTIFLTLAGYFFLQETISLLEGVFILIIIISSLCLAFLKNPLEHIDDKKTLGICLAILSSFALSGVNYTLAILSREMDPLVAGYFWEVGVTSGCGILLLLRFLFFRKPLLQRIDRKTYLTIAVFSLPTLLGTGLYSLATRDGPIAIVNAIGASATVFVTLLAWWLYNEKLRSSHWIAIIGGVVGIVGLKFV